MATIREDITRLVRERPGASFPELARLLDHSGHDTDGDYELSFPNRADLVLWSGMSEGFAAGVSAGDDVGDIHAHVLTSELEVLVVYVCDGGYMNLPRAKRPPLTSYKKPHWVPVVWYPGGSCQERNCIGRKTKTSGGVR